MLKSPAMAPERWRRLRPLLDRALDLDGAERADFIAQLPEADSDLRADLLRLLDRHQETTGIRESAAVMAGEHLVQSHAPTRDGDAPFVGRRIGAYVLTRLLGAGGMGAVYEGQRVDGGFRQTVAIKLVSGIHPGLNARFARERQILAELRHPQIAQLLDGGETEDGMPYFTLEYVDGQAITEFADTQNAGVDQRLRLLIEVAEALAYAHRRDVIHRDIKPTNILVTGDGHVKLLDFGIAKLLKGDTGPTLTHQQMGPMTPEYAAPEQFRGGTITAATDVYQFGVLMFRLLSGRLPYRATAQDGLAWARAVSEEEPISLSGAMIQARKQLHSDPPSPDIDLRRYSTRNSHDLEQVVRRCLAKEKSKRYGSMDAVIADLQEYLVPNSMRVPLWRRVSRTITALLMIAAVAMMGWRYWPSVGHFEWSSASTWDEDAVLGAMGLRPENLHLQNPSGEAILRKALQADANGDLPTAMALLETLHADDPITPVPALLLSYWSNTLGSNADVARWRAAFETRIGVTDDAYLRLLARFMDSDAQDDIDGTLQFSGALLQLRPNAWYLHMARAHRMNERNLREAALAELQAITVTKLSHRRLAGAIADRASFGDLAGALAHFERLEADPGSADRAVLAARLAYSSGDLRAARDRFVEAIALGRRSARFDVEARASIWAGVFSGSLGDYAAAATYTSQAQSRFIDRSQFGYAAEAAIVIAHLAAMNGDQKAVAVAVQNARDFSLKSYTGSSSALLELAAARISGAPLREAVPALDASDPALHLLAARRALQAGQRAEALSALASATGAGIYDGYYAEEAAAIAQELGQSWPAFKPIDPPFAPYQRYAARWMLGVGDSVVPKPSSQ